MSTTWPNELPRGANFFWTRTVPRPTRETWPHRLPTLEAAQANWDEAANKVKAYEAGVAERRQARERQQQEQRDAAHAPFLAKQEAAAKARKGELRASFLAAGGSAQDWEREGPGIVAEDRRRRTLEGSPQIQSLIGPRQMVAG
jgi:hypothetical protein